MERVDWVVRYILPHEAPLRRWVAKLVAWHEIEDIVQEAYCELASLDSVSHIEDPQRYLFQTTSNIVKSKMRRSQVVQIQAIGGVQEIEEAMDGNHDFLSPERIVADRLWLNRIDELVSKLPARAAEIFRLSKVEGLAQKDIARNLGVSETIVENDLTRGLRAILQALSEDERVELSGITKERNYGPRKR